MRDNILIFKAFLLDSYRELNAKKMFWLVLVGSALVAMVFACFSIEGENVFFFSYNCTSVLESFGMQFTTPEIFFKDILFYQLGVDWWLTFFAMILAIVSTGSIMPDFMSQGSIDLSICRPVSRTKLFVIKYFSGLLFVTLQITIFTFICFLIIGFKADSWELGLFSSIPLIVCFFSYFYCVSFFLAVFGRGTLACIIITLLFWALVGGLNVTHEVLTFLKVDEERAQTRAEERGEAFSNEDFEMLAKTYNIIESIRFFLPKSSETVHLIRRCLVNNAELNREQEKSKKAQEEVWGRAREMRDKRDKKELSEKEKKERDTYFDDRLQEGLDIVDIKYGVEKAKRDQSFFSILGTSFVFEFFILGLACWKFNRKDF